MIVKDWAQEAANEIADDVRIGDGNEEVFRAIIVKHCPMKEDTAYMPVPRCDSCKHYKPERHASAHGWCRLLNTPLPENFGCVKWEAK